MKLNKPYKADMNEAEWLRQRKLFITATEASILMGVNPFVTPTKLLKEKALPPTKLISKFLDRGLENEEGVLKTAAEWLEGSLMETQGFYANTKTRISATPDGILHDGRMIEAKCTGIKNLNRWEVYPPIYYIMQCQVQMYVTGARENYLMARFFYNWPEKECEAGADRMFKVTYSREIMEICEEKVKIFWKAMEDGSGMRNNKDESDHHKKLLKNTCESFRGHILMQKVEIEPIQRSIVRQTCLKAAAKLATNLENDAVIELATELEDKIFMYIVTKMNDTSRNLLIQIGACLNGYVEGNSYKGGDIDHIRQFVVKGLKNINR